MLYKEGEKWPVTRAISWVKGVEPSEQMEKLKLLRVQRMRKLELALERRGTIMSEGLAMNSIESRADYGLKFMD